MSWLEAARNIATGAAALLAAWVALEGLRAWRVQLHGKAEYELARRVLRAAFRVRDQIAHVRSPFVPIAETMQAYKDAGLNPDEIDISRDSKRRDQLVYQRRWQPLASAISDLSLEMLEAEVLWGQTVRECEKQMHRCVGELNAALTLYVRDVHTDHRDPEKGAERMERQFAIVYAGGPNDELTGKVDSAVKGFEDTFRPHLKVGSLLRSGANTA